MGLSWTIRPLWVQNNNKLPKDDSQGKPAAQSAGKEGRTSRFNELAAKVRAGNYPKGSASIAVELDQNGLPRQLQRVDDVEIGPAHASADEAAAAAVNTRGAGHNLEVIVSDAKGNIVASWHEASEIGVGNRARGTRLGHTEQKALLRVRLMEGVHIEMRGHYPPCNGQEGCRNALQVIADETGARISYRNLSVPRSDASVTEFIRSGVPESER